MERTARKEKTKVDYSKPIKIEGFTLDEGDCFGRGHDALAMDCQSCHDSALCQLITYNTTTKLRVEALKKKRKGFLDEADFDAVDQDKLLNLIKDNPGQYTVKDIVEYMAEKIGVQNLRLVELRFLSICRLKNIEIIDDRPYYNG